MAQSMQEKIKVTLQSFDQCVRIALFLSVTFKPCRKPKQFTPVSHKNVAFFNDRKLRNSCSL